MNQYAELFYLGCPGIFRRVAGLLLTGLVLGAVLFYVGLKLAFPSYS